MSQPNDTEKLIEAVPGGGGGAGSHAARLNFKTCRVGLYKCFTSLSEMERKSLPLSEF